MRLISKNLPYLIVVFITFVVAVIFIWWPAKTLFAEDELPVLYSHQITSEFPQGFRVEATAKSKNNNITAIAIRLRIGQQTRGAYDYLETDVESGKIVNGKFFWRTGTSQRYIPPGTIIEYNFEIEDAVGNRIETEPQPFIYFDARFVDGDGKSRWQEVSEGKVAVAYKGPVKKRAEDVLRVINETLEKMRPVMGDAALEEPIRVTMYNNQKEMLEALPPKSMSISRELITEGQAFTDLGTLLVLGGGRLALGTASHEVMHIITHRAGDSIFRKVPAWLDEGLSEFANVDPGYSYDIALEFAIETNRLLPHVYMSVLPGKSEDMIIFYGQARSIVRMMINTFGPDRMKKLMAELREGTDIDQALMNVYGMDREELDRTWRQAIGGEPMQRRNVGRERPTPIPQRVPQIYSLTPQAQSELVSSQAGAATPTPQPTAILATTVPEPSPGPVVKTIVASPTQPASSVRESGEPGTLSSCAAPLPGMQANTDLSMLGMMIGLVGLATRRRKF